MNKYIKYAFTIILLVFATALTAYNYFSPLLKTAQFNVTENLEFKLPHNNLIINSEKVYQDSLLLQRSDDYHINYQEGKITFTRYLGNVSIEYSIYPSQLTNKYNLYQEQEYNDTTSIILPQNHSKNLYPDTNLNITGNKTIAISVANNEEFSLDQSLFLRINGELSKNLQIEAQLTDSQSPITPEGDSREISSLDQLYIRLYGDKYELAFGDLEMQFTNSKFINYNAKFEGMKAGWHRKNQFRGALAISKGKKYTYNFKGLEAKQGPYYLMVNNVKGVQVIPGSEEVYLNGSSMERGCDYTIDYSEGSITFRNKHFITSNSFIQVTFQYSDEDYRQNMYLVGSDIEITDRMHLTNHLIIQNDDKRNPLQEDFNDDDIEILKQAGDEPAWGNGIMEVESGTGQYKQVTENDEFYYVYVADTTPEEGNYNIVFSYVGLGKGSYEKSEDGNYYTYTGINTGSYLPVKSLPAPENKTNYDLGFKYSGNWFNLTTEGIVTNYDHNTYSYLDDKDNLGYAFHAETQFIPDYDKLKPELKLYYRALSKNLSTFSELNKAIDNYEMLPLPDSLASNEYSAEIKMNISNLFIPYFKYSRKFINNYAAQNYFSSTSQFKQKWFLPGINYRFLYWEQEYDYTDEIQIIENSHQTKHDLAGNYIIKPVQFGAEYYFRKLKTNYAQILAAGEQQTNWKIHLGTAGTRNFAANIFYKEENTDSLLISDTWNRTTTSATAGINSSVITSNHKLKLNYSHRKIKEKETRDFDMADFSLHNSFLHDVLKITSGYSLNNLEFYPKIRELQYVGEELGIYDSLGFVAEDGEYDWVITSIDYDNPQMSIEINSNMNIFFTPKLITDNFLKKIQTETNINISENSRSDDKRKLYLLHPDILMNEKTTIFGKKRIQQTLWYDIIKHKLNAKLKYFIENTLDNRYQQPEHRKQESWEGSMRLSTIKNTDMEIILENRDEEDSRFDSESISNSIIIDIGNKLTNNVNLKSTINLSREDGCEHESNYKNSSLELIETLSWFFQRKYRLFAKASVKHNTRDGSANTSYVDKKDGNIFKWNLNLNYRINKFTYVNAEYSGNIYPAAKTIHQLKMEVKAEF